MKKIVFLILAIFTIVGIEMAINQNLFARVTSSAQDSDIACWGPSGAEVCVDSSGNLIPTTDDDTDLGTSTLQWQDGYFDGTVYADVISNDGAYTGTSGAFSTVLTAGTHFGLPSVSSTALVALDPEQAGDMIWNSTRLTVCVSTSAAVRSWMKISTGTLTELPNITCIE
jgi:hypothetical protein